MNWARLHGKGASTDEARRWNELITPLSVGLILQNINTTFKFVRQPNPPFSSDGVFPNCPMPNPEVFFPNEN